MKKLIKQMPWIIAFIIIVGILIILWEKQNTHTTTTSISPINHSLVAASNQWYTSIYKNFPTQPLFALPLAFQISQDGLGYSYPQVTKTSHTIFAPYIEDFHVGFSTPLQKPTITAIGDWHVTVSATTANGDTLSSSLAHGVPSTMLSVSGKSLLITPKDAFFIYNNGTEKIASITNASVTNLLLSIRGHSYLIAFPQAKKITTDGKQITIQNPSKIFIALLDKKENYDLFLKTAKTTVINTGTSYEVHGENINTTYNFSYSGEIQPLIALYPHQTDFLSPKLPILGTYQTIRGTLSLIQANQFVTSIPTTKPLETFPSLAKTPLDMKQAVKEDIDTIIKAPFPTSKDYYLGVWFGKASTLLQLSSTVGLVDEEQKLLQYMKPKFIQSIHAFHYDKTLQSVIADTPEFGNEQLNDHHFHYGYFIRTAAILAKYDPTIIPSIKTQVTEMVGDISNTNKQSLTYPYLRNFDIYEGHSWASGDANFADGNDQESSSEAINAWYGIYLWSKVTKNSLLENLAISLYSSEITATQYYWFGKNSLYNTPYEHSIASIIWGGKVDFSTWFSPETNKIYGIQLLPFTPGSMYLGSLSNFTMYDTDFTKHGGMIQKDWGDLYVMWKSFYNPKEALQDKKLIQSYEEGNNKSNLLYFLYYNNSK